MLFRSQAARADAEALPFADQSFDLVLGHAVLHHLPNLRRAFAEFHRVLRPGGRIAFAGEPSRVGDRIAALPKQGANRVAPLWRRLMRAAPAPPPAAAGTPDELDHDLVTRDAMCEKSCRDRELVSTELFAESSSDETVGAVGADEPRRPMSLRGRFDEIGRAHV